MNPASGSLPRHSSELHFRTGCGAWVQGHPHGCAPPAGAQINSLTPPASGPSDRGTPAASLPLLFLALRLHPPPTCKSSPRSQTRFAGFVPQEANLTHT